MFKIMCEWWNGECEVFEGTLEECVRNFDEMDEAHVADPWEERCYIVDENGNEMNWFDIEEMGIEC